MNSTINSLMTQMTALEASFKTMEAYPKDALEKATMEIVKGGGLQTPTIRSTDNGFIGAYRATNPKRSLIATIKKNDGVKWSKFNDTRKFSPQIGMFMNFQFQHDDQLTITHIFGADYWEAYRSAMLDGATTSPSFENCVRLTWRCVMGDYLYWRTTANLYLEAMEAADTDLKRSIYAQKAKIAHNHSEQIKTTFNLAFPDATITDTWLEA